MRANEEPFNMGQARAISESDNGLQVEFMDDEIAELVSKRIDWIPKSQVHEDSEVWSYGHKGVLIVSLWIAEQRGWS